MCNRLSAATTIDIKVPERALLFLFYFVHSIFIFIQFIHLYIYLFIYCLFCKNFSPFVQF